MKGAPLWPDKERVFNTHLIHCCSTNMETARHFPVPRSSRAGIGGNRIVLSTYLVHGHQVSASLLWFPARARVELVNWPQQSFPRSAWNSDRWGFTFSTHEHNNHNNKDAIGDQVSLTSQRSGSVGTCLIFDPRRWSLPFFVDLSRAMIDVIYCCRRLINGSLGYHHCSLLPLKDISNTPRALDPDCHIILLGWNFTVCCNGSSGEKRKRHEINSSLRIINPRIQH